MLLVSCRCVGHSVPSVFSFQNSGRRNSLYLGYAVLVEICIKSLCSKLAYVTFLLTLFGLDKSCGKPNNWEGKYSLTIG